MPGLAVQFGCGWCAPHEWLNYDSSPTLRFERTPLIGRLYTRNANRFPENARFGNIAAGLPLPDACCDALYASHVLEHLALDELRAALQECRRLLMPDGLFRAVVPDLAYLVSCYRESTNPDAAIQFMKGTELGWNTRSRGVRGFVTESLGNSRHRWMWDYLSLREELLQAGFKGVRRASFGDSSDVRFRQVEAEDRWENALGIECAG